MLETPSGTWGVLTSLMQETRPSLWWWGPVFCLLLNTLSREMESWTTTLICITATPVLITVTIPAHLILLLKKCPAYRKTFLCCMYDRSYIFKMHFYAFSQILRERIGFHPLYHSRGSNWCLARPATWNSYVSSNVDGSQGHPIHVPYCWSAPEQRGCFNFCFFLQHTCHCFPLHLA